MEEKRLTFFEASSIIAGYGVGGGVMAVPFLTSLSGFAPFFGVLAVAFFFSIVLHLMLAEIAIRDTTSDQLVELIAKYYYRGPGSNVIIWALFVLLFASFLTSLAAYVSGSGEILNDLAGIPVWAGQVVFYILAAGVVLFGLKSIGLSEKYAVIIILVIIGILTVASLRLPFHAVWVGGGSSNTWLALFGMIMYSFLAPFAVPQVVRGLSWNQKLIPRSIITGIFINLCVVTLISLMATGVSEEVTRVAISGWGKALGGWAHSFGGLFILVAMLTSYWAVSYALVVILKERLGIGDRFAWLLATLPTLVVALTGLTDFMGFMRITAGVAGIVVILMVIPTLRGIRKHGEVKNPEWKLNIFGNTLFQVLLIIVYILVGLGSLVSI
ncbi:hypothetical protein KJ966_03290 [bacterium]|nr:hypothetical protein [bacterium]